jgi:hypothetical protein
MFRDEPANKIPERGAFIFTQVPKLALTTASLRDVMSGIAD